LVYISGEKLSDLHEHLIADVSLDEEVPLNFESHPDLNCGYGPDLPWRRSALSECFFIRCCRI